MFPQGIPEWTQGEDWVGQDQRTPATPLDLPGLLPHVADPRSTGDVRRYFAASAEPRGVREFSGSRFERSAGGGDHLGVANAVTAEDLVAVTLLSVEVPGPVALGLLEGKLGEQVGSLLPTDVALHEPGVGGHGALPVRGAAPLP